jgi:hypothetical protein
VAVIASSRFAVDFSGVVRHQCGQEKESLFRAGVLYLDRTKSRHPWLLLDSFRRHPFYCRISDVADLTIIALLNRINEIFLLRH